MTEQTYSNCLMLPAPADSESKATEFHVDSETSEGSPMKLDRLGPMVVNSDGTLSRIANWAQMTEPEQARTLRVLSARNKVRLANEARKQEENQEES